MPVGTSLWGAIIDDLWVLHTDEPTEENEEARRWAQSMEDEWARIGVESHPNKRVDAEEGHEVEGAYVDAEKHVLRLSWEKTELLMRRISRRFCQPPKPRISMKTTHLLQHAYVFVSLVMCLHVFLLLLHVVWLRSCVQCGWRSVL